MTELLTAAQMRAIEQTAIASGEVTGLELMERAGRGVVEAILEEWPDLAKTSQRAVVLCGPGNNGGDGFVVARLLKERGWEVEIFLYGDEAKLPPDATANCERWRELGDVKQLSPDPEVYNWTAELFVDAIFGTGLTRGIDGLGELFWTIEDSADLFEVNESSLRIVAVDIASGLCADSGKVLGIHEPHVQGAVSANLTVTFHRQKLGHLLGDGPPSCRMLSVKDIGLGEISDRGGSGLVRVANWSWSLSKHYLDHKYDHGHALILSGGVGKGGAARLAARGALRIGAGLVTVGCPPAALIENAARLDAVMVRSVKDPDRLGEMLEDARLNALCLGPGMGRGEPTQGMVKAALAAERATVLDADALTSFDAFPQALFAMLHPKCILTPHAGEFARLFPDIARKLDAAATRGPAYSKVDATREAAKRVGCVVLFKGADTVIAGPDGRCSINSAHYERAAPWLATAGSGDVLAGFITGLLARGLEPMAAAETAAWLHVECAREFGPGLIAEDLPEQLPAVFRGLEI